MLYINKLSVNEINMMIMLTEKTQLSGSDPLGRYYTHSLVSKTLVPEMNLSKPNLVVDLGTGDGFLSAEAAQIWTSARFIICRY